MKSFIKCYVTIVIILSSFISTAQQLNEYKYVVVPTQFEFQSEANEYDVNEFTVFMLEKVGFKSMVDTAVNPADVNAGICNTLYIDVIKSGFLRSTLQFTLKNCKGDLIYTSPEGSAKERTYDLTYRKALRIAFKELLAIDYEYKARTVSPAITEELEKISQDYQMQLLEQTKELAKINKEPKTIYTSEDKLYKIDTALKNQLVLFKGSNIIGIAQLKNEKAYLVNTKEFIGLGYWDADTFIIHAIYNEKEIEIKFKR